MVEGVLWWGNERGIPENMHVIWRVIAKCYVRTASVNWKLLWDCINIVDIFVIQK